MRPMLPLLIAGLAASSVLSAADAPVAGCGLIERDEAADCGTVVVLRFDAATAAKRLPGEMVGLYAAGTVEKHPLTGQVIVAKPILVAKAQLTEVVGRCMARVRWIAAGTTLASGMDAITLPGEAAPNATPALSAAVPGLLAAQGAAVQIAVPVVDADRDPLLGAWSLEGPKGRSGRLLATSTGGTGTTWIAPESADGPLTAIARIRDPLGQEVTVRLPLATGPAEPLNGRSWKPLARWGQGLEAPLLRVERDGAGTWWGLSATGQPLRIQAGWLLWEPLALPQEQAPKRGVGLQVRGDELHVLDQSRGQVVVYGTDSTVRRSYGRFDQPTDLALAADGTAFVADQAGGGIEIVEPDGTYRGRLGRAGKTPDTWQGLIAVAVDRGGELYALDQVAHVVVHYDRFQRRVETWTVPGDPADEPVDLAVHPTRGVVVLYQGGRLVAVGPTGAAEVAKPDLAAGVEPGPAKALAIDGLGAVITCHTERSALVRYDATLHCVGMRAERGRTQNLWAADGAGRSYGLDQDTGLITVFDGEGWAIARVETGATGGGLFGSTLALAVEPSGALLWITDSKKRCIHRIDLERTGVPSIVGAVGTNNGQFEEPVALAVDEAGRVYVLDAEQYRVQVFDRTGAFLFAFAQKGKGAGELYDPEQIAASPAGDACFVYDSYANELKKYALDQSTQVARHVTNGGGKGSGPGQIRKVTGLACDRLGLLFALDTSREDLQVFDFRGNSCLLVTGTGTGDLGSAKGSILALAPDGQIGLHAGGRACWWRW